MVNRGEESAQTTVIAVMYIYTLQKYIYMYTNKIATKRQPNEAASSNTSSLSAAQQH